MLGGQTNPRWQALAVGPGRCLVGTGMAAACEAQTDAQPPVASVDFEPRLVVSIGDADMNGRAR